MNRAIYTTSIATAFIAITGVTTDAYGQARIKGTGVIYAPSASTPPPQEEREAKDDGERQGEAALNQSQQPEESSPQSQRQEARDLPGLEEGGRLELVCGGAGAANKQTSVTGHGSFSGDVTSYGYQLGSVGGSTNTTYYGTRRDGFADEVALFIEGQEGRLRMPRTMLPPVRGGKDGWFKLGDIQVKDNEITATVRVNFMNNPKMRIDRYTGGISISGKAGDYSGQCQRIVPEQTQRQF